MRKNQASITAAGIAVQGMIFGLPDGTIESFLAERGFAQVKNISSADLHRLYFNGKRQKRKVVPGYGIVTAVV